MDIVNVGAGIYGGMEKKLNPVGAVRMLIKKVKKMSDDRGPNDLEKIIQKLETSVKELEKDNWRLAKEVDRLNDYVQILEMQKKK